MEDISNRSAKWLSYSYLIASLALNSQRANATIQRPIAFKKSYEIRGTVSLREIYGGDGTFESAITGADLSLLDREDFVRMILLNRFKVTATVLDKQYGGSKPVGKVTLTANDFNAYEFSFLITDLPEEEPIVVEVEVPAELALDSYQSKIFQAVGWTGIAILTRDKPKLEAANFSMHVSQK